MLIDGKELPKIVPPPKPDDGVQQVIKPDAAGTGEGRGAAGSSVGRTSDVRPRTSGNIGRLNAALYFCAD